MKAIVCTKYGSPHKVLELKEVAKPKQNEILINGAGGGIGTFSVYKSPSYSMLKSQEWILVIN